MQIFIQDYDYYGLKQLGVDFYGEPIHDIFNKEYGVRSYKFNLHITTAQYMVAEHTEINTELLSFVHTMDLKRLPFKTVTHNKNTTKCVNWEKFIPRIMPEQYNYLVDRLERKANAIAPSPVIYTNGDWHRGDEFLEFTKSSANNWGGPFILDDGPLEQDSKHGCCASVKIRDQRTQDKLVRDFDIGPINKKIKSYHVDFKYSRIIATSDDKLKSERYNALLLSDKIEVSKQYVDWLYRHSDEFDSILPVRLYLCGNDDISYSKYFATQEEADAELNYLRRMQPLDFVRDIMERGYHFTN